MEKVMVYLRKGFVADSLRELKTDSSHMLWMETVTAEVHCHLEGWTACQATK